jgi:hypothetical protein
VTEATFAARCSSSAREQQLDPAGTAGSYDGVLLAEWPLPWPRDIGTVPELAELHEKTQAEYGGIWRLQALAPLAADGGGDGARSRAPHGGISKPMVYLRPREAFAAFESKDATADRLVLVCTHGNRDRCCGSLGAALFHRLPQIPGVGVRRTSHTGGHRFAPTALVFPEGTSWAYLDEGMLTAIVERTAPVDEAARHYRGCFGLDGPELQVADRQALLRHGWAWLDTPRSGAVLERDGNRVAVRIEAPGLVHEMELEVHHSAPVVQSCGKPLEAATRTEPQWRIVSFT